MSEPSGRARLKRSITLPHLVGIEIGQSIGAGIFAAGRRPDMTALRKWDLLLGQVGECVQVAAQGDDMGLQQSTYISPETPST